MQLTIFETPLAASLAVAELLILSVGQKPGSLLCLDSTSKTAEIYSQLSKSIQNKVVDFSKCHLVQLCEWLGCSPDDANSKQFMLQSQVVKGLKLKAQQCAFFDALTSDIGAELSKMRSYLAAKGPLDCAVLELQVESQLGFNQAGDSYDLNPHLARLDDKRTGFSLGIGDILAAETVILVAFGIEKAEAVKASLRGQVDPSVPASILQMHGNCHIFVDKQAARKL